MPAFSGVRFDMAVLFPVLALVLTHGQVAGLPACFYSVASLIRFHQPRRRHLARTEILSLLSDICFAYTDRGKY